MMLVVHIRMPLIRQMLATLEIIFPWKLKNHTMVLRRTLVHEPVDQWLMARSWCLMRNQVDRQVLVLRNQVDQQ